jgi:hypothetical protein
MPLQETLWLETWAYIMIIIVCFSILFTLLTYVAMLFWKHRFNLLNNTSNNNNNNVEKLLFTKSTLSIGAKKYDINFQRHNSIKNKFLDTRLHTVNEVNSDNNATTSNLKTCNELTNSLSSMSSNLDAAGVTSTEIPSKNFSNGNVLQQAFARFKHNLFDFMVSGSDASATTSATFQAPNVNTIKSSIKQTETNSNMSTRWSRRNSSLPMSTHSVHFNESNCFEKTDSSDENNNEEECTSTRVARNNAKKAKKFSLSSSSTCSTSTATTTNNNNNKYDSTQLLYMKLARKKNSDSGISTEPSSYYSSSSAYSSRKNSSCSSSAVVDYYRYGRTQYIFRSFRTRICILLID